MSWAKIDDRFLMNPKVMAAGLEGRALYLASILYAAGELTDGKVPRAAVRKLAALSDVENTDAAVERLITLNLWEADTEGEAGDYLIHDYLDYNPCAKEAKEHKQNLSQKRAEAGRKGAANRWQTDGKGDGKNMAPSPSPSPSLEQDKDPPNPPEGGSAGDSQNTGEDDKPKGKVRGEYPADMTAFWQAYPKAGRERGSLVEVQRQWLRMTAAEKEDAARGLAAACSSQQFLDYPPGPQRWLRDRKWEGYLESPALVMAAPPPPKKNIYSIDNDPAYQRQYGAAPAKGNTL